MKGIWLVFVAAIGLSCMALSPSQARSPQAWWAFYEDAGNTIHDVSGNDFDATNSGGGWIHDDWCGCALALIESADIVSSIPATFDDTAVGGFTVSARMMWHGSTGTSCYIFDARMQDAGFNFMITADGHLVFQIYGQGYQVQQVTSQIAVPVGCWVTLSAVLDRSSQRIQLFINGDADPSVPAQFDYRQTDFTAAIGNNRWQDGQYRVLNGCVENVIFYDEPVIPEPMGAWWTFDEGSGDILHDVTENGNDAANIGGSWSHVPYLGSALDLTDASDIVRGIPETFDDQALEGFTVCVGMTWHGPTGTSCYIFDSRTQDAGFNLMIGQDRHLYFQIYDEGAHVQQIRSVNEVPAERPVCVGAMFDRIQHQLQLFINGQADDVVAAEFDYFDTYLSAAIGNNRWYDGQWRVANASIDDVVFYNAPVRPRLMGMLAGVEEQLPAIEGSWLGLPFPNPVRDAATLVFTLAKACPVDASIWTVDGRAITTLIHGWLPEGEHRATWCGVDDQGRRIPAGVYYLRVQAGDRSQMQRISVLR